jgi:hypothetical protein
VPLCVAFSRCARTHTHTHTEFKCRLHILYFLFLLLLLNRAHAHVRSMQQSIRLDESNVVHFFEAHKISKDSPPNLLAGEPPGYFEVNENSVPTYQTTVSEASTKCMDEKEFTEFVKNRVRIVYFSSLIANINEFLAKEVEKKLVFTNTDAKSGKEAILMDLRDFKSATEFFNADYEMHFVTTEKKLTNYSILKKGALEAHANHQMCFQCAAFPVVDAQCTRCHTAVACTQPACREAHTEAECDEFLAAYKSARKGFVCIVCAASPALISCPNCLIARFCSSMCVSEATVKTLHTAKDCDENVHSAAMFHLAAQNARKLRMQETLKNAQINTNA